MKLDLEIPHIPQKTPKARSTELVLIRSLLLAAILTACKTDPAETPPPARPIAETAEAKEVKSVPGIPELHFEEQSLDPSQTQYPLTVRLGLGSKQINYKLEKRGTVTDGKRQGTYVVLEGNSPYGPLSPGLVDPQNPNVIHIFKGAIEEYVKRIEQLFGPEFSANLEEAVFKSTLEHEGTHWFLEGEFPYQEAAPFVVIDGNRVPREQVHELCSVGAELSKATSTQQFLTYWINKEQSYALMNTELKKRFLSKPSPLAQKILSGQMILEDFKSFMRDPQSLEIIRELGREMYETGVKILAEQETKK